MKLGNQKRQSYRFGWVGLPTPPQRSFLLSPWPSTLHLILLVVYKHSAIPDLWKVCFDKEISYVYYSSKENLIILLHVILVSCSTFRGLCQLAYFSESKLRKKIKNLGGHYSLQDQAPFSTQHGFSVVRVIFHNRWTWKRNESPRLSGGMWTSSRAYAVLIIMEEPHDINAISSLICPPHYQPWCSGIHVEDAELH